MKKPTFVGHKSKKSIKYFKVLIFYVVLCYQSSFLNVVLLKQILNYQIYYLNNHYQYDVKFHNYFHY